MIYVDAIVWYLRCLLTCWRARNKVATLTIVRADHHIGG